MHWHLTRLRDKILPMIQRPHLPPFSDIDTEMLLQMLAETDRSQIVS
jgi:hypothetical protein